jgi:hypothetical protein
MRVPTAALGAAFLLLVCVSEAAAQAVCLPRGQALEHLAAKYGEAPVARGVTGIGGLLEVLASPSGGTWTILVTRPSGRSCVVAAGEGWRPLEPDHSPRTPTTN